MQGPLLLLNCRKTKEEADRKARRHKKRVEVENTLCLASTTPICVLTSLHGDE